MKNLIDIFSKYILKYSNLKNTYNFSNKKQKYNLNTIIDELIYISKSGVSWRLYRGPIKWNALYYHFKLFIKFKILDCFYKYLLDKYLKKRFTTKLKYNLIDSTVFVNKYGIDLKGRNKQYRFKNTTKLSVISDSQGIPISMYIDKGSEHDSTILLKHFDNFLIDTKTFKFKNHNRYKQYLLADSGYDSKKLFKLFTDKGYSFIIPQNKRNIKDDNLIRKFKCNQKNIYKKRIKVENLFCYLKNSNKRISHRYEKKSENFKGFILIGLIRILFKKFN